MQINPAACISVLTAEMLKDEDYAWTWHCNIAVCFMDEGGTHRQANQAAARFMKLAFGIDVTTFDAWKYYEAIWNPLG